MIENVVCIAWKVIEYKMIFPFGWNMDIRYPLLLTLIGMIGKWKCKQL